LSALLIGAQFLYLNHQKGCVEMLL